MRLAPWWFVIVPTVLECCAFAQESRPASKPSIEPAGKEALFRPDPADKDAKALIHAARQKIVGDWIIRKDSAPPQKRAEDGSNKLRQAIGENGGFSQPLENPSKPTREQVLRLGLEDKSGVRVLPLGRFVWTKPLMYEGDDDQPTAVLCVLVATASVPVGDIKGFRVKGEFQDKDGKKLSDFEEKSLEATPPNGVFVLTRPAGDVMKNAREYEGFQFRLIEVQALK